MIKKTKSSRDAEKPTSNKIKSLRIWINYSTWETDQYILCFIGISSNSLCADWSLHSIRKHNATNDPESKLIHEMQINPYRIKSKGSFFESIGVTSREWIDGGRNRDKQYEYDSIPWDSSRFLRSNLSSPASPSNLATQAMGESLDHQPNVIWGFGF